MRHVIHIQQLSQTADGGGGFTAAWTTITGGERRASVTDINSDEAFAEGQLQERVTHRVITRYLAGVTTGMRVLMPATSRVAERVFDIRSSINVNQQSRTLVLRCLERMAA